MSMKKSFFLSLWLVLSAIVCSGGALGADADKNVGSMVFCGAFSDAWEPQGAASVFDSNVVSWMTRLEKPFGIQKVVLSVYTRVGFEERVVLRQTLDVRPTWNVYGMRNLVLPGKGEYVVALEGTDGSVFCEGKVAVGEAKKDAGEVKTETLGAALAKLFEQYAPKK
jgi:hypothetical protein